MTKEKTATAQEFAKLYDERKQARELCDLLAEALKAAGPDGNPAHTYEHQNCGLCLEEKALAAYEARPWRYSG